MAAQALSDKRQRVRQVNQVTGEMNSGLLRSCVRSTAPITAPVWGSRKSLKRANARLRRIESPIQARLSDADRGPLQPQTDVRSDAQAARMGDALTIKHQQVRLVAQTVPGSKDSWPFAEGQQPRHVREVKRRAGCDPLDRQQVSQAQHDNGCSRLLSGQAHINATDGLDRPAIPAQDQSAAQALLDSYSLIWRERP